MRLSFLGQEAPPVDELGAKREEVAEKRAEQARRNPCWRELPEARLIERGRLLVDAETDHIYSRRLGTVFERGSARVMFDEGVELWFFVAPTGGVVFLERHRGTWSERVAKKMARRST